MLKSKFMGLHYKKIWYHTSWLKSSCHCKRITKVIRNLFMVPNWPLLTCWVPNSTVSPSGPARSIRAKYLYISYTNAGKWRKRKTVICATFFLTNQHYFQHWIEKPFIILEIFPVTFQEWGAWLHLASETHVKTFPYALTISNRV